MHRRQPNRDPKPTGTGINGGIFKPKQGPWPGNIALYIDVGVFCLFDDPDGRILGLWQQG